MNTACAAVDDGQVAPRQDIESDRIVNDIFAATLHGDDPAPLYRALRERHTAYYARERGMWIVTGFAEVEKLLCSPAALLQFDKRMATVRPDWRDHPATANLEGVIAFADGEPHRKIRRTLTPGWTKTQMEKLRPKLRAQAEKLVDAFVANGGGNFAQQLALPMAEDTLYYLFGMNHNTPRHLPKLVNTIQYAFDFDVTPEQMARADQAAVEMRRFWEVEYRNRIESPGEDMLSILAQNPDFSVQEGVLIAESLYQGGFDSTALTATTGMWLLLTHPGALQQARADDTALSRVPDEVLRMGGAIPMTIRVATETIPLGEQFIREGDLIGLVLLAANRDPAFFNDPEHFDLTRAQQRNLSFSSGVHACLGHWLARMELYELYRALLDRTRTIAIVGEATFRQRQSVRGIDTLVLAVD